MERKHYIDNLRWLFILLLFPFHAAQIWCSWELGGFYVWSHSNLFFTVFSTLMSAWYMTLLFTIAGVSCNYSLRRRSASQFVRERITKLLIPCVFGTLVLAPIMTFIGERFFNGFTGSYLEQYVLFFTKETDLSGYKGGFTPAHFWFLLYLFVISLVFLGVRALQMKVYPKLFSKLETSNVSYAVIVFMFIPEWLFKGVLDIGGKSLGQFLFLFVIGYYVLSDDKIQEVICRYRYLSLIMCLTSGALFTWFYCFEQLEGEWLTGLYLFYGWTGILSWLGWGQKCLNFRNRVSGYLTRASFPIYILHMPILVVVGYYVLKLEDCGMGLQFIFIMFGSAGLTFIAYEAVRRIPGLRFLLGIHP